MVSRLSSIKVMVPLILRGLLGVNGFFSSSSSGGGGGGGGANADERL